MGHGTSRGSTVMIRRRTIIGIAAYLAATALVLLFNYGAHRNASYYNERGI